MDSLLDLVKWNGPANPSIPDKLRFLEGAFLAGFQANQRAIGLSERSRDYAIDADIFLKHSGGNANGQIGGWRVTLRSGQKLEIKHKRFNRRPRQIPR